MDSGNANSLPQTTYWLDCHDRLREVCASWDEFALDNEGPGCVGAQVRGRPIWDFVAGDDARMWLRVLLMQARMIGRTITRPYRCDSPRLRRFMEMSIQPEQAGELRVRHTVLRTEPREAAIQFHGVCAHRTNLQRRCSVCGRIEHEQGWVEPERAITRGGPGMTRAFQVVYAVCDECLLLLPSGHAS